jgi:seryl-tRNA synthetase
MHDIKALRADPAGFDAALARRGIAPVAEAILTFDKQKRQAETESQEAQARRNAIAKAIGGAKRNGEDTAELEAQSSALKLGMEAAALTAQTAAGEVQLALESLPNFLDPSVPDGAGEQDNQVLRLHGAPLTYDFTPVEHFQIGEGKPGGLASLMDFATAAKLSGARFVVLRGALARLERALGQFMLDLHTKEHGYTEISPPALVNSNAVYGTGQLPKFSNDLFQTADGRWLIPTAEVPLTNMAAGEILDARDLPLRFAALTDCFRSEAGAAGRDTRGMLRQHQFRKVEMVSITHPEASWDEHERMTRAAETVLERLGLAYRRIVLCAGDTGFSAAKTYDLEVWLPGQGTWREISSCSNTLGFQARRMAARFRDKGAKGTEFVHTLNGSGVAVGRALIAVLETYQRADGTVAIPQALLPYMGGVTAIGG